MAGCAFEKMLMDWINENQIFYGLISVFLHDKLKAKEEMFW